MIVVPVTERSSSSAVPLSAVTSKTKINRFHGVIHFGTFFIFCAYFIRSSSLLSPCHIDDALFSSCAVFPLLLNQYRVRGDRFRDLLRLFREAGSGSEDAKLLQNGSKTGRHYQQAPVQHQLKVIVHGVYAPLRVFFTCACVFFALKCSFHRVRADASSQY